MVANFSLLICMKMDLELNNLQRLIYHKTQTINQPIIIMTNTSVDNGSTWKIYFGYLFLLGFVLPLLVSLLIFPRLFSFILRFALLSWIFSDTLLTTIAGSCHIPFCHWSVLFLDNPAFFSRRYNHNLIGLFAIYFQLFYFQYCGNW